MQVETQANMKSQTTGTIRKSSDSIEPGNKKNKRMKISHNTVENYSEENNLQGTYDSFENSKNFEKDISDVSINASREDVPCEVYENIQSNGSHFNGSLINGAHLACEENISNGNLNNIIFQNENDSVVMDTCESQDLTPPTLELQCIDDHYSSTTSEASEKSPESLKDFNESYQIIVPCFDQDKTLPPPEIESVESVNNSAHIETEVHVENELPASPDENLEAVEEFCHNENCVHLEKIYEPIETEDVKYLGIYNLKTSQLEGHADVVFCVAADDQVVISSSGDTTVKVWNVEDQKEVSNFAGHSDAVTCVLLLNSQQSKLLSKKMGICDISSIVISASMDCHIKVWSVSDAKEISSIYTYNSITCMGFSDSDLCVVIGTEGGKLEVWDLNERKKVDSVLAHESSVANIKVQDSHIYSASADGVVKVWLLEDGELQPLYSRKRRETSSRGVDLGPTFWKAIAVSDDTIFLGDNTPYLKALNWRLGRLRQYVNQLERNGVCDAALVKDNVLLTSSYDSRTDTAAINVWSLPDMVYVGTLTGDIQDICCLAVTQLEDKIRIISGGHQLVVWDFNLKEPSKQNTNTSFTFSEVEGIGVEVNEKPLTRILTPTLESSTEASDNFEAKRSSCIII